MSADNLQSLVSSEPPLDREALLEVLEPYIRIESNENEILPTEDYEGLPPEKQLLVTLFAEKARHDLDLSEDDELDPVELTDLSDMQVGYGYPYIRELEQHELISNTGGEYRIPNSKIEAAQEYILSHPER